MLEQYSLLQDVYFGQLVTPARPYSQRILSFEAGMSSNLICGHFEATYSILELMSRFREDFVKPSMKDSSWESICEIVKLQRIYMLLKNKN